MFAIGFAAQKDAISSPLVYLQQKSYIELVMAQENNLKRSITGCLLGLAVGDAIGLPFEGLSRRRQHRMASSIDEHLSLSRSGIDNSAGLNPVGVKV